MKIRVLLFAGLKEKLKLSQMDCEASPGETALQLAQRLLTPFWPGVRITSSLLFVVNNEYVPKDYSLKAGDELALIPPVAGG